MRDPAPAPVDLRDGARVRLAGAIRPALPAPLKAPLSARECVYWAVRDGLSDKVTRADAQPFWVEGDGARVLVRGPALDVDARAERRQEVLAVVEGELDALGRRLREAKDQRKTAAGEKARALLAEQKRLAKVVTLLCAVRAHARGRVHGRGTLASQERWIRENAGLAGGGVGAASTGMMVEAWEVALAAGQRVVVEGVVRLEPAPAGLALAQGYRDAATIAVLVGEDARGVRVTGTGALAPLAAAAPAKPPGRRGVTAGRQGRARGSRAGVAAAVAIVAAVAALLGYLSQR